ncbi:MAG: hypothetical protein JKY46_11190 [Robiginitomaculum sp.]|nr:hypothetical protein [Robiginitomaculum sp.]
MKKIIFGIAVASFCILTPLTAFAECPEIAPQNLYDLKRAIVDGRMTDANQAFRYANEAMKVCHYNAPVMGQTAEIYAMIGNASVNPKSEFIAFSQSYLAIINNGHIYNKLRDIPSIRHPGGKEEYLNNYDDTTTLLGMVIGNLAQLSEKNLIHDIYKDSYKNTDKCPHKDVDRIKKEVSILSFWAGRDSDKLSIAAQRLDGLHMVCKSHQLFLANKLAKLHRDFANSYVLTENWELAVKQINKAEKYADECKSTARNVLKECKGHNDLGIRIDAAIMKRNLKTNSK